MQKKVKIFDFETKRITEIPQSELAHPYVTAHVAGINGTVYINAEQAAARAKQQAFRHPPFDVEHRALFEKFASIFQEVMPMTVQEWEDGFRRDQNPGKEIITWAMIAHAYVDYTSKVSSLDAKHDYFNIILSCVNNGCERALLLLNLTKLSKARARWVIKDIRKRWSNMPRSFI